jgi:hypothetical protein
MMVLLRAPSLIGISSIYQYEERQALPGATAQSQQQTQITGTHRKNTQLFSLRFY